jgi:hypothetical protein
MTGESRIRRKPPPRLIRTMRQLTLDSTTSLKSLPAQTGVTLIHLKLALLPSSMSFTLMRSLQRSCIDRDLIGNVKHRSKFQKSYSTIHFYVSLTL